MERSVELVRRWAVDWLAGAHPEVCPEIMAPDYSLLIGGYRLEGRDAYIESTVAQLDRFPGLGVTIHELIASPAGVALRFTEHGASVRMDGRRAAWGGVVLHHSNGEQLVQSFAEEDYLSRRRQLDAGECDPIEAPAAAPWNTPLSDPDPAAEAVVRDWLERGDFSGVERDDSWLNHDASLSLEPTAIEIDDLFSAGPDVAFHAVQRGTYDAQPAALNLAGIVSVDGGSVVRGRVIRDRLGMLRAVGG